MVKKIAVCGFDVTVEDHEDPQISVNLAPVYLWPANNQINDIKATVVVWDNVPGATAVLTSITSNQTATGDILGETLGIGLEETTEDQRFTIQGVRCIGACGLAPVLMIDEEVYGKMTTQKLSKVLDEIIKESEAESEAMEEGGEA